MRKFFLSAALALALFANAQEPVVNDSVPATHETYCLIMGFNNNVLGLGNKLRIQIDFGDEKNFWGNDGRDILVDENGKDIKFNSMIDAMNYMAQQGWTFLDAYAITVGNQHVYHWLMKKDIADGDDAKSGINQRRDSKKAKKRREKEEEYKKYDDIY